MAATLAQCTAAVAGLAAAATSSRRPMRPAVPTMRVLPRGIPQVRGGRGTVMMTRASDSDGAADADAPAKPAAAAAATATAPKEAVKPKANGGRGKGKGGGGGGGGRGKGGSKADAKTGAVAKKPASGPQKNEDARKALALALETGEPVFGRVEVANRGGLILRIFNGRFRAFLPLSQMASSRTASIKGRHNHTLTQKLRTGPRSSFDEDDEAPLPAPVPAAAAPPAPGSPAAIAAAAKDKAAKDNAPKDPVVAAMELQVGAVISVMVTSMDDKKIVVSERALVQDQGAKALKVGMRTSGRVVSLSDFGAFVELSATDPAAPRLEGLIHISELSWNRISHPRDVVRVGQEVDVKVLDVVLSEDRKPARITFSLKQLQADPLLETLDTIMPVAMPEPSVDEDELLDTPLPGLLDICANLLTEDGIDAVIPGRQAVEQRVVSQDLELWLTNVVVADGYNLLARAGRQVQEIHVVTRLDRDAIKRAIKRATSTLK